MGFVGLKEERIDVMKKKILVFGLVLGFVVSGIYAGYGMDTENVYAPKESVAKKVLSSEDKAAKRAAREAKIEQDKIVKATKKAEEKAKHEKAKAEREMRKAKEKADRDAKIAADKAKEEHDKSVREAKKAEEKAEREKAKAEKEMRRAKEKADRDAKIAADKAKEEHDKKVRDAKKAEERAKLKADREAKKLADKAKEEHDKKVRAVKRAEEKAKLKADKEAKKIADKLKCDAAKAERDAKKAAHKAERDARKAKFRAERDKDEPKKVTPSPTKYAYLYKEPTWPFESLPYKEKDLVSVSAQFQYAKKAYNSSNHSEDITKLNFGQAPITIQNILLVSKLLKNGEVQPVSATLTPNYYLTYLADEEISFKGEMNEWRASLDMARHLTKNISVGFEIPFVSRYQKTDMQTNLSNANKTHIAAGDGDFPTIYNHSFEAFVKDIMYQKEIYYGPKTTVNGIGDVSAFFNYTIKTKHLESLNVGVKLLFPTSRSRDVHKLWDPELGNGGFTEVSPYFSMLYSNCSYFNPHFFAQGIYGIPSKVDRRVAKIRTFDGEGASTILSDITNQDLEDIPFSAQVKTISSGVPGKTIPFNRSDSLIKNFSDQAIRIKMQPGAALNLRVGNIFEKFITKKGFLDIFYDLYARGKDHVSSGLNSDDWDASKVVDNTYQIAHKICLNIQHQFDKRCRFEIGGKYTFAGRNVPMIYEADAAFKLDF